MKSITLFIVTAVFCGTVMCDRKSDWLAIAQKCSTQHNVSLNDLFKALKGEIKPADVTSNQKCMLLCIAESEGIMKGGVLQPEALSKKLEKLPNKDVLNKSIAACKDLKGANNCDSAYKIMTCLASNKAM